jgi:hypothetical protein
MSKYDEIEEIKKSNRLRRIQILTTSQLKHLHAEPTGQFQPEDEMMIFEKPKPDQ